MKTFRVDSETWRLDSETLSVGFGNFSGCIRKLVFLNCSGWIRKLFRLDSETFRLDSETFPVVFGNLYSETFPVGFRNFPVGFGNFSGCIRKLVFGNFSGWIQKLFRLDSETCAVGFVNFVVVVVGVVVVAEFLGGAFSARKDKEGIAGLCHA